MTVIVSMEKNDFWLVQCNSHFAEANVTSTKKLTKKCGILIIGYVDDMVIAMPILQDHSECLDKVFACMKRVALKCRSKCEILKDSMKYRERMVDKYGIRPDHDAAEAIPSVEISKNRAPVDEFSWFCKLL